MVHSGQRDIRSWRDLIFQLAAGGIGCKSFEHESDRPCATRACSGAFPEAGGRDAANGEYFSPAELRAAGTGSRRRSRVGWAEGREHVSSPESACGGATAETRERGANAGPEEHNARRARSCYGRRAGRSERARRCQIRRLETGRSGGACDRALRDAASVTCLRRIHSRTFAPRSRSPTSRRTFNSSSRPERAW